MPDKFIVNACLTGMVPTREMNANVPITVDEVARDVEACLELGASMFHIHSRDGDGKPDWRTEGYQRIMEAIRRLSSDVVVCASTSGRRVSEISRRTACVDCEPRPDMGSLTMGSINFMRDSTPNSLQTIRELIQAMDGKGVKPEIEVFDVGMARTTSFFAAQGLLRPPFYVNILLGNVASAATEMLDLETVVRHLPEGSIWCVAGIGKDQLTANAMGILFGHGVRVGLEDNLYMDREKTLATNPMLVKRVIELGRLLGKKPRSPAETRELLGL